MTNTQDASGVAGSPAAPAAGASPAGGGSAGGGSAPAPAPASGDLVAVHHLQGIYDQMITASIDGLHAYALTYLGPTGERATARALRAQMKEHTHA